MDAAGAGSGSMPDYLHTPAPAAAAETTFPIRWLGSGRADD
jgi:hypothetical protein